MRLAIRVILAQGDFSNQEEEAERLSTSSGLPGTGNKVRVQGQFKTKTLVNHCLPWTVILKSCALGVRMTWK